MKELAYRADQLFEGKALEFREAQDRGEWLYRELAYFLNGYALEASDGFVVPPETNSPAVQITTIHSAKGLQWPIVFLPGLEQRLFPSNQIGHSIATQIPSTLVSKRVLSRYAGSEKIPLWNTPQLIPAIKSRLAVASL